MTNATMTVTTEFLRKTGEIDETAYAAFLAKNVKSNIRARDKANARGLTRSVWYGMTDAECTEAARSYCVMYRHHFAIFAPANPSAAR